MESYAQNLTLQFNTIHWHSIVHLTSSLLDHEFGFVSCFVQIVARVRPPLQRELDVAYRQYENAIILDEDSNSITITEFPQSLQDQSALDASLVSLPLTYISPSLSLWMPFFGFTAQQPVVCI